MKLIEKEIIIAKDGKLPTDFREAFGRKARVAIYLQEDQKEKTEGADILSHLDGKIQAFRDIDDPVTFQRNLRAEWDRGWEK